MTPDIRRRLGACLLLLPFALQAQTLPKPKEFYFDDDAATARPIVLMKGDDDATIQRLMRTMDRGSQDSGAATAQLARIAYASGRRETGEALYLRALDNIDGNNRVRLTALWNHGWDLYRAGNADRALARWSEAGVGRFNNPSWVPPTLALALWTLDRKPEAVQWYAAAVRTEPGLWRDPSTLPTLLPDWRPEERAVLAEVAAAWQANPPAWP